MYNDIAFLPLFLFFLVLHDMVSPTATLGPQPMDPQPAHKNGKIVVASATKNRDDTSSI